MPRITNAEVSGGPGLQESIQITNEALVACLNDVIGGTTISAFKMGLYSNNLTPSRNTVLADLTEAGFDGYAQQTLVGAGAGVPGLDPDGNALEDFEVLSWEVGAGGLGELLYGCFIMATFGSNKLFAVARFASPVSMADIGDTLNVHGLLKFGQSIPPA